MDSERLVRVTVMSAALVAVIAFGVAFIVPTAPSADVMEERYLGGRILPPGPAPQGLPLIPVRVNSAGFLEGVPTHLDWYDYCQPHAPGLSSHFFGTNAFSYYLSPQQLSIAERQGSEVWYADSIGEVVHADDFTELWQGASVMWRTPTEYGPDEQLLAILVKVDPNAFPKDIREEFMRDGFAAFNAAGTHLCCVVGYQISNSPSARNETTDVDYIFDPCHDSRYDVRDIRSYAVPARP